MYYKKFKEEQKERATQLKKYKRNRACYYSEIYKLKYEYRHLHIALCELRGRKREQIEKPADNNRPNETYIEKLKTQILHYVPDELFIVKGDIK